MSSQSSIGPKGSTPRSHLDLGAIQKQAQQGRLGRQAARQLETKISLQEEQAEAFNPFAARMKKERKSFDERKKTSSSDKAKKVEKNLEVGADKHARKKADSYEEDNSELSSDELVDLWEGIDDDDNAEKILSKIEDYYDDPSLVDEVLDFLSETKEGDVQEEVAKAKEQLSKEQGREVRAGRNMGATSREYAEKELGTPSELRELYRDITGNPREKNELFDELSDQYNYDQLKDVIKFLLSSLGADMKADGPSIERSKLTLFFSETRMLQAILGVYRFFQGRMNLISNEFSRSGLDLPEQLSFELLARQFMQLVNERYPSAVKILTLAQKFGISDELLAQIILFSQMRDAVRGVSPRIYSSIKQRWELLLAIMEALEELEDELEEEEDELREEE
ncbi:type III secretion system gatekeeper subunit SctW [Simkania negevensis]|uniref:Type III secretion system gatekeeper subunit SctW n=1 Tax=Simkania negevensis TaxID=83561 RepID=A0ABS3ARG0_9BACT|nr:type III secretion system gatekeeper subunit SctW [Simkania negevensis]